MRNEFNSNERKAASLLDHFPRAKKIIKFTYQLVQFIFNKKKYKYKLHDAISAEGFSAKANTFGGYYDKVLINSNNSVLCHKISKKSLNICLNNKILDKSESWNYQQGSMLSFITDDTIIYNVFEDNQYKSVIREISSSKKTIIDHPIYTISKSGDFAIGVNFERLGKNRPDYGYFNRINPTIPADYEDGIFKYNFSNNQYKLILTLEELKAFNTIESMNGAEHWVNHIMINHNEKRFMFLHRWSTKKGKINSRLITSDCNGSNLYLLADEKMVSHCCWKDSKTIIGWMRKNGKDAYYELIDRTNTCNSIASGVLTQDGHPSVSKSGEWLLTDTYPDKSRMSKLLLFNLVDSRLIEIGRFFSPLKWDVTKRCDLHPRLSEDNNRISFDSEHEGFRGMYIIDIHNLI